MTTEIKLKNKTNDPFPWLLLAGLCLLFLFAFAGCDEGGPRDNPKDGGGDVVKEVPAPHCIGKVFVEKDEEGRITIGGFTCAGQCPGEEKCKPVKNRAGDREWCGCPGEGNPPEGCSTLKVKASDGKWRISCGGVCPIPTDICMPVRQVIVPNRKWAISCDCFSLPEVPRAQDIGRPDEEKKEEGQQGD